MFVIYDIVSEVEIKEMWDASPTLSRGILVTDDETKKFSETRTGTTAWLGDQEAPIAAKLVVLQKVRRRGGGGGGGGGVKQKDLLW